MPIPDPSSRLLTEADFADNLNIRVLRLASKISLLLHRKSFRPRGLSGTEVRIMIDLMRFGDTHLRALARITSLDASHLSKVMPVMERKGLIERRSDPKDKRRVLFSLTSLGEEEFQNVWPDARGLAQDVRALFSEAEFNCIRGGIDKAGTYIDALLGDLPRREGVSAPPKTRIHIEDTSDNVD